MADVTIKKLLQYRKRFKEAIDQFAGLEVKTEVFQRFVDAIHGVMGGKSNRSVLEAHLYRHLGRSLTRVELTAMSVELAANYERMRDEQSALRWPSRNDSHYNIVRILNVVQAKKVKGKPLSAKVTLEWMSGPAAGLVSVETWSIKKLTHIACNTKTFGYSLGFNYSRINKEGQERKRFVLRKLRDVCQLVLYATTTPEEEEPRIAQIKHTSSTQAYNRVIIARRYRTESGEKCPKGYSQLFPCYLCPHSVDTCIGSTLPNPAAVMDCSSCKAKKFFYRVGEATSRCLTCHTTSKGGADATSKVRSK